MPTSCPPTYRCGTHATGWLNGGHPTVADVRASRQVCFHWDSNCCHWSTNIKVEIAVHIMCTILMVHLLVVSVIVALTKNKVQVK